jgi:hypothetical protein
VAQDEWHCSGRMNIIFYSDCEWNLQAVHSLCMVSSRDNAVGVYGAAPGCISSGASEHHRIHRPGASFRAGTSGGGGTDVVFFREHSVYLLIQDSRKTVCWPWKLPGFPLFLAGLAAVVTIGKKNKPRECVITRDCMMHTSQH